MFTIHFVSHLVCSSVLTSLSPQMLVCFCCRKGRNFSVYTKLCELITWDPHVGFQFYVLEPTGFYSANSWVPRACLIILRVEDKRSDKCIIHSCGWHKHFPPWRNWYSGEHAVNRLSISEVSTFERWKSTYWWYDQAHERWKSEWWMVGSASLKF